MSTLPVTAVQMWIIAFKFIWANKIVYKLGLGTAKNNATENIGDKCEFHPHGVRVSYTMLISSSSSSF